ncbi:MAG: stage II sporulation protein P [Bacillota bacterium]|nr:stage II sporulation protein P [Bacillota bacterium]
MEKGMLRHYGPLEGRPRVLILSSHRYETYDCRKGEEGPCHVVAAARLLAKGLGEKGWSVFHDEGLGETGGSSSPYSDIRPLLLARVQALSPDLIIDVHRDALTHEDATDAWRGKPTARLLLVVGSRPLLPYPWRQNLELAAWLTERLQEEAPRVMRGIWVKTGSYNQEVGPPSLLLEIGGHGSRPDEVRQAVTLLLEVLPGLPLPGRSQDEGRP